MKLEMQTGPPDHQLESSRDTEVLSTALSPAELLQAPKPPAWHSAGARAEGEPDTPRGAIKGHPGGRDGRLRRHPYLPFPRQHGQSVTVLFPLKPGRASQSSTRPSAQSFLTTWYRLRRRQLPGRPIFERRVNREAQPREGLAWGHDPSRRQPNLHSDFSILILYCFP